jgi:type I restriction enzyme, S subunit
VNELETSMHHRAYLPDSWAYTTVAQIAKAVNPGFPSGKHNQTGEGIPHLRPMNINSKGELDFSIIKYVEANVREPLYEGDVLFNNTNSPALLGKTALITQEALRCLVRLP